MKSSLAEKNVGSDAHRCFALHHAREPTECACAKFQDFSHEWHVSFLACHGCGRKVSDTVGNVNRHCSLSKLHSADMQIHDMVSGPPALATA